MAAMVSVSALTFLQSCSDDEDTPMQETMKLEFLDLDVSNLNNPTDIQKLILKKAKDRIDPYIVLEGKTYILAVTNAIDVQMSERLFELIKTTISNTNYLVKNLNVVVDKNNPKLLHIVQSKGLGKNSRYKILGYESTPIDGQDSWNVDWSGVHIYLNNETTKRLNKLVAAGACAADIAGLLGCVPVGIIGVILTYRAAEIGIMNDGNGIEISYGFSDFIQSR